MLNQPNEKKRKFLQTIYTTNYAFLVDNRIKIGLAKMQDITKFVALIRL